jgi:hypothetical protein
MLSWSWRSIKTVIVASSWCSILLYLHWLCTVTHKSNWWWFIKSPNLNMYLRFVPLKNKLSYADTLFGVNCFREVLSALSVLIRLQSERPRQRSCLRGTAICAIRETCRIIICGTVASDVYHLLQYLVNLQLPQSIFVAFIWLSQEAAIISLNKGKGQSWWCCRINTIDLYISKKNF